MDKQKFLSSIGMAFGARKIVFGAKLLENIKNNKVDFVILTSDMGSSQKKKLIDKCNFYNVEFIQDQITIQELSSACGKELIVAIGLNDKNFIKLIKSNL